MDVDFFAVQFWLAFFNIIVIDIILSGDNAVVIGMAAKNLPVSQQKKAIMIGTAVAIFLRAALTAIAAYLLKIPLLMSVGGVLLLWIAVKLLLEEEREREVGVADNMRSAVRTIIIADVVMSLDNVIAVAGAAHGSMFLIIFGLALSIPIIMWGSSFIAKGLKRYPWLIFVGSGILGYTAGDLIIQDPLVAKWLDSFLSGLEFIIPILLTILVIGVGMLCRRRRIIKQNVI